VGEPLCRGELPGFFLGVIQSPIAKLEEFVTTKDPPFDLVADPEMLAYRVFGVEHSILKMFRPAALKAGFNLRGTVEGPVSRVPADFLIDSEGVIRRARYGAHIADHVALNDVSLFLETYAKRAP